MAAGVWVSFPIPLSSYLMQVFGLENDRALIGPPRGILSGVQSSFWTPSKRGEGTEQGEDSNGGEQNGCVEVKQCAGRGVTTLESSLRGFVLHSPGLPTLTMLAHTVMQKTKPNTLPGLTLLK